MSDAPVEFSEKTPDTETLPHLRIYSHSLLFYWWPVWLTGFTFAGLSYLSGDTVRLDKDGAEYIHQSSALGISFTIVLLAVITFTTASLRGLYSLVTVLAFFLVIAVLGWAGLLDDLVASVPELSIHMNMGFYLLFSSALFVLWLLSFFIFDRMTYWVIRPGQMTEEHLIGDAQNSYDTRGMLFEKYSEDYFRNLILGLGAGDLRLTASGAKKDTITIRNVLFVDRKVVQIQELIAVQPDDLLEKTE